MPTDPNSPAPDASAQRVVSAGKMGQDLLSVPFPDMVRDLAMSIASAQMDLDRSSVRIAQLMAGYEQVTDPTTGVVSFQPSEALRIRFGQGKSYNLLQLGFTPTFYQFVDTIIEVKIAITMASSDSYEQENKAKNVDRSTGVLTGLVKGGTVKASSVNARYSQQYSYSAEGSSLIRTKLVPIPPPAILEERIRKMMEAEDAAQETEQQSAAATDALNTANQKKTLAIAEKDKALTAKTAARLAPQHARPPFCRIVAQRLFQAHRPGAGDHHPDYRRYPLQGDGQPRTRTSGECGGRPSRILALPRAGGNGH